MRPRALSLFILPIAALIGGSQLFAAPSMSTGRSTTSNSELRSATGKPGRPTTRVAPFFLARTGNSRLHRAGRSMRFSVCSLFGSGDISPCNEVGSTIERGHVTGGNNSPPATPHGIGARGETVSKAYLGAFCTQGSYTNLTPCGQSIVKNPNQTGQTTIYTVKNNSTSNETYVFHCSKDGVRVVSCSVSPSSKLVNRNSSTTVTVTYATGSTGGTDYDGYVEFSAAGSMGGDNAISHNGVWVQFQSLSVTPKAQATNAVGVATNSQNFTVTNTGSYTETYALTSACSGTATSCVLTSATSVTLGGGGYATATVSYTANTVGTTGTVKLIAKDATNSTPADTGSISETAVVSVAATPDNQTVNPAISSTVLQVFTITNNRPASTTYFLSSLCSGVASSCSVAASVTVPAQSAAPETLSYHTSATAGSGRVSLYAVQSGDAANKDSASVVPSSLPGGTPVVSLDSANAGALSERELCLDFSLGSGAASECGDLRLVYVLPSIRTRSKSRAPTLLYNSQFAYPNPIIAANVTMPSGIGSPDSVTAVLKLNGVVRGTGGKWNGPDWATTGSTRRIAVAYPGLGDSTNIYSYSLEVSNWYASTKNTQTASGQIIVVNRATSRFGAGWWLAGLERLKVDSMLWVGGDGSARKYALVTANVWAARAMDRPDTLKWNGSRYVRYLPHGLVTQFDASGRHVLTLNRIGDSTRFTYDASSRLDSIVVPGGPYYKFFYSSSSGLLDSVTAPGPGTTRRSVVATRNADGTIAKLRDPQLTAGDTIGVRFGFVAGDTNRVHTRTDRRATAVTYSYDAGKKISQASLNMGTQPAIVSSLRPAESQALRGSAYPNAASLDSTYTRFDGPRTDVTDVTKFWLDRYGEPTRIINALGDSALLARSDSRWPALLTQVTARNGHVVKSYYNSRGNEDSTVDVNPYNDGRNALTKFLWDPKWDFAIRITQPAGEIRQVAFDATNGNRLWEQPGSDTTDHSHRVTYSYDLTTKLLRSIQRPVAAHADSLFYDTQGNLAQSKSAIGFRTYYYADTLGRDTLLKSPTDSAQTQFTITSTAYDAWDRVVSTKVTGATSGSSSTPTKTLAVQNFYNSESKLDSLWRWTNPNTVVDTIRASWRYDPASRTVAAISADGKADSLWCDPAGNVTQVKSRRSQTIVTSYDALNRVASRTSDNNQSFSYDRADNMLTANNNDAHIARTYFPNGAVATDTLHIRTWTGSDFSKHVYPLTYTYDLDGRKTSVNNAAYSYDTLLGALAQVSDWLSDTLQYHYDGEGRVDSLRYSSGMYGKNFYDDDGRLTRRVEWGPNAHTLNRAGFSTDTIHDDRLRYDARGKVILANTLVDSSLISYDGMGAVSLRFIAQRPVAGPLPATEFSHSDALGQQDSADYNDGAAWQAFRYDRHTGRLIRTNAFGGQAVDSSVYDASGNVTQTFRAWVPPEYTGCTYPYVSETYARWYSFDQHVDSVQKTTTADPSCIRSEYFGSFDHFRYDALGRRVLTRSYGNDSVGSATTSNSIERYTWDGNELLTETHYPGAAGTPDSVLENDYNPITKHLSCEEVQPHDCGWSPEDTLFMTLPDSTPYVGGYGRISYVQGGELDRPMAILRQNYGSDSVLVPEFAVMPHYDWRGHADIGTYSGGYTSYTYWGVPIQIDLFAPQETMHMVRVVTSIPHGWFGSLLAEQRSPAGDMYMRNRYYDPMQGRFMQEDPIGLAGGLNLYGFANGDPANYDDPFGLCSGETTKEERANRTQSNTEPCTASGKVGFAGFTGSAIIGIGLTTSIGRWSDSTHSGPYLHLGFAFGIELDGGAEKGTSTTWSTFHGGSPAGCHSLLFGVGACSSLDGNTKSVNYTKGSNDPPLKLPVNNHVEIYNHTFAPTWGKGDRSFECAKNGTGC
jgi:RHS repeat-associated protein